MVANCLLWKFSSDAPTARPGPVKTTDRWSMHGEAPAEPLMEAACEHKYVIIGQGLEIVRPCA